MPGLSKIADKRGNKKCKTGEVISLLENLSVFLQTLWWRFAEKSDSKTEVSNVERISSAILHLHFWAIFELIRRSNAGIVTEDKFEKSRKGRGVYKIFLANSKIAEVIFSTLLSVAQQDKRIFLALPRFLPSISWFANACRRFRRGMCVGRKALAIQNESYKSPCCSADGTPIYKYEEFEIGSAAGSAGNADNGFRSVQFRYGIYL